MKYDTIADLLGDPRITRGRKMDILKYYYKVRKSYKRVARDYPSLQLHDDCMDQVNEMMATGEI